MTEIEDEEHLSKVLGQFSLALNGLMKPLRLHGRGDYVTGVSLEIIKLAWTMHWKLCGLEIPYEVEDIHW